MSEPSSSRGRPLTSQEVVLLCDELRAILAAGVPLHLGLRHMDGLSPNLQRAAERLAHLLEQGASLQEALEAESYILPPTLRAIVVAGVYSDRSQELLEELARTSEQFHQMRSVMVRGMVYPTIVVVLTLALSSLILPRLAEAYITIYETSPQPALLGVEARIAQFLQMYGWTVGPIGLGLFLLCWVYSAYSRGELSSWAFASWLPGTGQIQKDTQLARSVHLLSLLLRHQVPLPKALRSVAITVDTPALQEDILLAATQVENGEELSRRPGSRIPQFLWWMLTAGLRESRLEDTLLDAAEFYRRRAIQRAEWISRTVPLVFIVLVAGGCTLTYGLFVLLPFRSLLRFLMELQP